LLPEQQARLNIDRLLIQAGWVIQDFKQVNPGASFGIAIREYPLRDGFADYLLFVDRKPFGVIGAKTEGKTLPGVAEQTQTYITSPLRYFPNQNKPLRFAYETTGVETYYRYTNNATFQTDKMRWLMFQLFGDYGRFNYRGILGYSQIIHTGSLVT